MLKGPIQSFRFSAEEIVNLIETLEVSSWRLDSVQWTLSSGQVFTILKKVPEHLNFNGHTTTATEAMCLLLHRLSSKSR